MTGKGIRRVWVLATMIPVMVVVVFAGAYFGAVSLGNPKLALCFDSDPPWEVESGRTFKLGLIVLNNAWMFAAAKHVHLTVQAPEDFTINGTGANEVDIEVDMLRGSGDARTSLVIRVPYGVSSGSYDLKITVSADNVPTSSITRQIAVEQPILIP